MERAYYSDTIARFLTTESRAILGDLNTHSEGPVEPNQIEAWTYQIDILKKVLEQKHGKIYFEYSIPRMGKRIDVVLVLLGVVYVIEFKVGAKRFDASAMDQVWDYALDLKNFHETSHDCPLAPILVASEGPTNSFSITASWQNDNLLFPVQSGANQLSEVIEEIANFVGTNTVDAASWEKGRYHPTPTIIEAALALYQGHSVKEISRSDASAINLSDTTQAISDIIETAQVKNSKAICFVTGVPGAGKTLVGLNIATEHLEKGEQTSSVFLWRFRVCGGIFDWLKPKGLVVMGP